MDKKNINLLQFVDIIRKDIKILYCNNQQRFTAEFDKLCEIKNGSILESNYGKGETPLEALNNFTKNISGKKIVFNAYSENREEYIVPVLSDLFDPIWSNIPIF